MIDNYRCDHDGWVNVVFGYVWCNMSTNSMVVCFVVWIGTTCSAIGTENVAVMDTK